MSDSEIADVLGDFTQRFDTKEEPFMRPRSVYQRDYVRALFWPSSLAIHCSNLLSINVTNCLFREKHSSYCYKNFTLFSHADELEVAWQTA